MNIPTREDVRNFCQGCDRSNGIDGRCTLNDHLLKVSRQRVRDRIELATQQSGPFSEERTSQLSQFSLDPMYDESAVFVGLCDYASKNGEAGKIRADGFYGSQTGFQPRKLDKNV